MKLFTPVFPSPNIHLILGRLSSHNLLIYMARPERFELPTAWFVARYSIQLSYGRNEIRTQNYTENSGGVMCW